MAGTRKPQPNSPDGVDAAVGAALKPLLFPRARLVLGLSGGLDSVVLLEVLRRLAGQLGFRLACVHVDHGISPNARRWAAFCARRCKRHGISLEVHAVDVGPYRAEGLEAAARRARYRVYAGQDADFVVLAQHLDDQAETLLLQLLRGAGVKGGAAMPLVREQDSDKRAKRARAPAILRPMLAVTRKEIEAYAKTHKLKWVEDESNADSSRDRNFLRHRVLPVIGQAFPGYRATLARSAAHLAEADEVLGEVARADAQEIAAGNKFAVADLKRLGSARARNLLRWTLQQCGAALPEADRLEEALRQLVHARDDAAVRVVLGTHELRRYAGDAYLLPLLADPPAVLERNWDGKRACVLPELGGILRFARTAGAGLNQRLIRSKVVCIRLRQGGERLRLWANGSTRSLKNLLQEARVPPWERERMPLIYCGDTLVAVPGVGVAAGWQAGAGDLGWTITWQRQE